MGSVGVGLLGVAPVASGQGLEELRVRYPEVKWYDPHGRVLTVWGTPMTRGETPREAADEWVFWHGDVFGSAGGLDLDEFRDVKLRRAPEGKERRVFMYRQTMDMDGRAEPLAVVGSSFRVMTEGDPDSGPAAVVYVAGRVATRPMGGLPAARVTPAGALGAAKAHKRGRGLAVWGEPELVAICDDAPGGDGVAYPVWRMHGVGESFLESYSFYVDAVSGVVVRHYSNIAHAHASGDIEGTVTGYATPGLAPDVPITSDPGFPWYDCDNEPIQFDLADVHVAAYEEATMETLVAAASTDLSGDYTLGIPTSEEVYVFADLRAPHWVILDGSAGQLWSSDPPDPLPHSGNPVTAPAMGVDLQFNPTPTEKWTGFLNAHRAMSETVRWLDLGNAVPLVPVLVHVHVPDDPISNDCWGALYVPPPGPGPVGPGGGLVFWERAPQCSQILGPRPNGAYSTVVAHEYGHFIATNLLGIAFGPGTKTFHEGFSDSLTFLVFDTEIFAEDWGGCEEDLRYPRNPDPEVTDPVFPRCEGTVTCSTPYSTEHYCRSELLSALWRDLDEELDNTDVRELFLDWIMIAQAPTHDGCSSGEPDQAADQGTLLEVLQAAGNTSPHIATICDVFEGRLIEHPGPAPHPCQDSAGWYCYADCDGSTSLDFWDFLCFQNAFVAGDSYADCDGDGRATFFDFLCFQNEFVRGCP